MPGTMPGTGTGCKQESRVLPSRGPFSNGGGGDNKQMNRFTEHFGCLPCEDGNREVPCFGPAGEGWWGV